MEFGNYIWTHSHDLDKHLSCVEIEPAKVSQSAICLSIASIVSNGGSFTFNYKQLTKTNTNLISKMTSQELFKSLFVYNNFDSISNANQTARNNRKQSIENTFTR